MNFDTATHKVLPETMNEDEKKQFVDFLREERQRHQRDIEMCELRIKGCKYLGQLAKAQFYQSAIKRHVIDITELNELVEQSK